MKTRPVTLLNHPKETPQSLLSRSKGNTEALNSLSIKILMTRLGVTRPRAEFLLTK
jgi:hypothetical protein